MAAIGKWSWDVSNGESTDEQTRKAYTAIKNEGHFGDFSYRVWNDMCKKVNDILYATGEQWDSRYATYASTKMSSSDKILTAQRFNSLRYNIGSHYGTGITEVKQGDTVKGEYFITLANSINGWIEQSM